MMLETVMPYLGFEELSSLLAELLINRLRFVLENYMLSRASNSIIVTELE